MLNNITTAAIRMKYQTPFGLIMLIIAAILIGVSKYIAEAITPDEEKQKTLQAVISVIGVVILIASKFVDSAMAID